MEGMTVMVKKSYQIDDTFWVEWIFLVINELVEI